ncbi:MAG TPA: hypothetical protein PKD10_16120 [Paracoccaceae bacterium]|nr:hypothetical protein [Paracoccaceae bacterium]HMO73631.1 hypothetical protein [Paracoccaceae bacterium]
MTIYPARPQPFDCAICGKAVEIGRWSFAWRYPIRPICLHCADTWGRSIGGLGDRNPDRRHLRLVSALSEALLAEAHRAQHRQEGRHGRA